MAKTAKQESSGKKSGTGKATTASDTLNQAAEAFTQGAGALADLTGRVIGALGQLNEKLVCTAPAVHTKDAIGLDGEVSVTVPSSGTGEVIVSHGGALRHYAARGKDARKTFKRGTKVKIVDSATTTLYIDEF